MTAWPQSTEATIETDADRRDVLLDEAIAAFHAMLVTRPDLVRVRLELARAFFLKREDSLARRHFETVLAGDVPEAVKANARLFLAEIRARRRWSFNAGFALAPDTNIGGGSDERTITIYGLPFERDAEQLTTSGIGLSVWGGAEYQVPVSDWWRFRAGAQASRREYERTLFDQNFVALHLGPRWLLDAATDASLLASARQHWSGTAPNYRELGGRLEVAHRFGPRLTSFARASWHDRRYRTRTHLDGPVWDASLRGSWVVTPTVRAELSGGYAQQRPTFRRERHRGRWLGTGVSVALPLGFTVGGSAEVRWTDYQPGWFPFVADGGPREDRTPVLQAQRPQPGVHAHRLQPGARSRQRDPRQQRPAPRLPPHVGRTALHPAVLNARTSTSSAGHLSPCCGRRCCGPLRTLARTSCASRPGRQRVAGFRCRDRSCGLRRHPSGSRLRLAAVPSVPRGRAAGP